MGRQPVFIARNKDGVLNAFLNACSHRGAMLCRHKRGNKLVLYLPVPRLDLQQLRQAAQGQGPWPTQVIPPSFNCEGSHDLTKVARFESYRGFLFGSLNADVVPLAEHLGESAKIIDMIVDQSPDGLEVLRGSSSYIYEGNWKLDRRKRCRRLPRQFGALELCRHPEPAQGARVPVIPTRP